MTQISILLLDDKADALVSVQNNPGASVFCFDSVPVDSIRYYPGTDMLAVTVSTYPSRVTRETSTGDVCIWGKMERGGVFRDTGHEVLWESTAHQREIALRKGSRA